MKKNISGQLLLPMLALLFLLGVFLAGFVQQCRTQYWRMKMDIAAKATSLSAMRTQAEIMNTLATLQLANTLYAVKARFGSKDYAYSTPQQRALFDNWNNLMVIRETTASFDILWTGIRIARLNGANGIITPLGRIGLHLRWQPLTFVHILPVPPYVKTETRPHSFLTRLWWPNETKAQPDHVYGWTTCRQNGPCGEAWSRLWLDVRASDRLHNGGFPVEEPSYLRSIAFQSFYPQFNAQLKPRAPRI